MRNIDLPQKVVYKKRRERKVLTKFEYRYRQGRTIDDFKSFIEENPTLPIVEMDTVKGARGKGKVLLTMIFRNTSFMLIFLMPDGTQKSVLAVFDYLTDLLGLEIFRKLFPVILTDNGVDLKIQTILNMQQMVVHVQGFFSVIHKLHGKSHKLKIITDL